MEWTINTLSNLCKVGYTGKIEFNFFKGGVTGVNFNQSIKPLEEVRVIPIGHSIEIQVN